MYKGNCENIGKGRETTLCLPVTSPIAVAVPEGPLVYVLAKHAAKGPFASASTAFSTIPLARIASLRACFWQAERPGGLQVESCINQIGQRRPLTTRTFRPLIGWPWKHNKLADVPCCGWRGKVSHWGRTSPPLVSGAFFKSCNPGLREGGKWLNIL